MKQISQNEWKFSHQDTKFILSESSVGVYGIGRAVSLYQLNGVKKEFIKCIGWTSSDNHGGPGKDVLLSGIVNIEACKSYAVKYLKDLMS